MHLVSTRDFGEIEVAEDSVVEFPRGLPAFEDERRFVLIQPPSLAPLVFLQSAANPALAFTAVPMQVIDAGYELSVLPEDYDTIDHPEPGQIAVYAVLTFSDDGPATANLLAPIVLNTANRKATQAVRSDSRYSHKHPLGDKRCS
jgi:flagellar assembly factor FliW